MIDPIKKFWRTSQKLNGQPKTQLNKQPKVKTDNFTDPKLNKKNAVQRDERLINKPMPIKKRLERQKTNVPPKSTKKKSGPPRHPKSGQFTKYL